MGYNRRLSLVDFLFDHKNSFRSLPDSVLMKILLGGGKHQLDTVQLVYLAGTRIVVDGDNIGLTDSACAAL